VFDHRQRFDSAFGDWAEKYPVTIAAPAYWPGLGEVPVKCCSWTKRRGADAPRQVQDVTQEILSSGRKGSTDTPAQLDLSLRMASTTQRHPCAAPASPSSEAATLGERPRRRPSCDGPATLRNALNKVKRQLIRSTGEQVGPRGDAGPDPPVFRHVPASLAGPANRIEFSSAHWLTARPTMISARGH